MIIILDYFKIWPRIKILAIQMKWKTLKIQKIIKAILQTNKLVMQTLATNRKEK